MLLQVLILAKGLKGVMSTLISRSKSAFLPGRRIFNGVVVVNEIIDLVHPYKSNQSSP